MVIKSKKVITGIVLVCLASLLLLNPKRSVVKDKMQIILKPENIKYDLEKDYDVLDGRVALTFQDANLIKEKDGFIIEINPNEIKEEDLSQYLEFFICEMNEVYLADTYYAEFSPYYAYITQLNEEDFENYYIRNIDENTREISIQLSDRVDVLVEDLKITELAIVRDSTMGNYATDSILEQSFDIVKDNPNYTLTYTKSNILFGKEDSFMYSLMADRLSTSYNYYFESNIDWQKEESIDSSEIGINQVSQLDENDLYTITYKHLGGRSTFDELSFINDRVKERLDCLEEPYMYAINNVGEISIKISKKCIGDLIVSALPQNNMFSLKCGMRELLIPRDNLESDDENKIINFYLSKEVIKQLDEIVSKSEDKRVYLVMNEYPIAYMNYVEGEEYSKLSFENFCYKEDEQVDAWFINLIDRIYNGDNEQNANYQVSNIVLNKEFGNTSEYGVKESYLFNLDEIKNELMQTYDSIEVDYNKGNLFVRFNKELSVDEIVKTMEEITSFVQSKQVFISSIHFEISKYEFVDFSFNDLSPELELELLDEKKIEFNNELVNKIKQNEYLHSVMEEEHETINLNYNFDEFFSLLWKVVLE